MTKLDTYTEFYKDSDIDQPDGSAIHNVRTKGEWGIACGVNKDGNNFLRVFELPNGGKGLNNQAMRAPGAFGELSSNHHDVVAPKGFDVSMMADGMMSRLYAQGADSEGMINFRATQSAMEMCGYADNVGAHVAERNEYETVRKKMDKAFDGQGPSAFGDKPSKHAAVLENLQTELHAGSVKPVEKAAPQAAQGNGFKATTVPLGKLGR